MSTVKRFAFVSAFAIICMLIPITAVAQVDHLIDFELKDQFGDMHARDELSGQVIVLIASDKEGSKYNKEWARAVANLVSENGHSNTVRLLGVGDVQGVPFFLKRYVRGKFPKNRNEPVLMDWGGLFAKTYGFVEKETNILIFDPDNTIRLQTSVTTMDSIKLRHIKDEIQAAVDS